MFPVGKLDPVSLADEQLKLADVITFFRDAENALIQYFASSSPAYSIRFISYTSQEVLDELAEKLEELEVVCSLSALSIMEASIRVDYLLRCRARKRDKLSKKLTLIYKERLNEVRLDEDILETWKNVHPEYQSLIGDLRGILHYRHWVAHGRYWTPKLARRKYDFIFVSELIQKALYQLPLHSL